MCKNVNADNLRIFLQLARHYEHKKLESALVDHVTKEVTLYNFEQLMELGNAEKIEGFMGYCLAGISKHIQKIDYEPSGFGKSTKLKDFKKCFDLAFKYSATSIVNTIITQMRKVLCHPGYGAHLEKLIEYLALTCDYQSLLPPGNDIQILKQELHQKVLEAIGLRAWRDRYEGDDEYGLTWPLIEECLKIAEKHNLQELNNACEAMLLTKISTDSYNKIVALANQFKLTQLKEACQKQRV